MRLTSNSFTDGGYIPEKYALAKPDPVHRVTFADNLNPHLAWDDVPEATRSFALLCYDPVAPSVPDDVNQEGREIPPDLPRVEFFHWVVVDLPAELRQIEEGEFASGVVPHGRQAAEGPHGSRQGLNDYTGWFEGDPSMKGKFYGYDGCAPPWNDSLVHDYLFTLYAVDVERAPVEGDFTGADVRQAIAGRVLAEATIVGKYTQNPRLRA